MAIKVERESQYMRDLLEEKRYASEIQLYKDLLTGSYQIAQQQYQTSKQAAAEQASYNISGAYANYLKQQRNIAAQGRLESGYKKEVGDLLQQQYQSVYDQARDEQSQIVMNAANEYQKTTSTAYSEYLKNLEAVEKAAKIEAGYRSNIHSAIDAYVQANLDNFTAAQTSQSSGEGFKLYETVNGVEQLTSYGKSVYTKALLEDEGFKNYLQEQGLTDELQYYLSAADKDGTSMSSRIHEDLFGITHTGTLGTSVEKEIAAGLLGTQDYIESVSKPKLDLKWKWNKEMKQNAEENIDTLFESYMPNIGAETISAQMVKDALEKYIPTLSEGRSAHSVSPTKTINALREVTDKLSGESLTKQQLINYFNDLVDDNRIEINPVGTVSGIFDNIIKELEAQSIKKYRGE